MDPGLDKAADLSVGRGWVAADIRASDAAPVEAIVEGGVKVSQNWAAYGDVWARPTVGTYGGDVGARYGNNLDIYASGQADTSGGWQASAGLKWRF